jgi:uncharacterized membrane-anchored protein YjiN (DUF445 family)
MLRLLFSNYEVNKKIQNFYLNSYKTKRKKHFLKFLFIELKSCRRDSKLKEIEVKQKLRNYRKYKIAKFLFNILTKKREESKDEKLKQDLIKKLKEKASYLLGGGDSFK